MNLNRLDDRLNTLREVKQSVDDKIDSLGIEYDKIYKKYYKMNIVILGLSAMITFTNASSILILDKFQNNTIVDFIGKIISLLLSTIMTLCTSIIRFRNYRDRLERIKENIDKLNVMRSKIIIDEYNSSVDNIGLFLQEIGTIVNVR